jgi:hypothetical protein
VLAGDHHLVVCVGPKASSRDRRMGGDERAWWRRRDAVRGDHHPGAQLALGAADQPSDRDRGCAGGVRGRSTSPAR